MKQTVLIFFAIFLLFAIYAQESNLRGVVVVINSKEKTGTIEYVKGTQIECFNPNKVTTSDNFGKFVMYIPSKSATIKAIPTGKYEHYKIVDEKSLKKIRLPEISLEISICDAAVYDYERALSVGLCLDDYKTKHEYDKMQRYWQNVYNTEQEGSKRWHEAFDSLNFIVEDLKQAAKGIENLVDNLMRINLDFINESDVLELNRKKAYQCAKRGDLDSVYIYLEDTDRLLSDAFKIKNIGQEIVDSAQKRIFSLIEDIMFQARTFAAQNKYENAISYYEKAINANPMNVDNIEEFADYLYSIVEYPMAKIYYRKNYEIYCSFEKETPNAYLPDMARTLNSMAIVFYLMDEYPNSIEKYQEALAIYDDLIDDNKKYLSPKATILSNLGLLYHSDDRKVDSENAFNESLRIRRELANENQKQYCPDVATTLNNLGSLHCDYGEVPKAIEEYKESLRIRRELANQDRKEHLSALASVLNNFGVLYLRDYDNPNSREKLEEALDFYRELLRDNPKTHLPDLALCLHNLAVIDKREKYYQQALKKNKESLAIRTELARKNPKGFLSDVLLTLGNLANVYLVMSDYHKALEKYEEQLKISIELAKENPKYLSDVVQSLNSFSWTYLFTKEYVKSEQFALQALEKDSAFVLAKTNLAHALLFQNRFSEAKKIYKKLSQTQKNNNETYTKTLIDDLDEFEAAGVIPEKCKANVEKIRKMLKNE
jgi:tetratricopeptide (TPR) repeat protein